MSVIPLSQKEAIESLDATEGTKPYGSGTSETTEKPGSFSDAAFDKIFESAVEKLNYQDELAEQPRTKNSLDEIISENMARAEAQEEDAQSFKASREARDELQSRYGSQGDLSQTINQFIAWAQAFQQDPRAAGLRFAESYMRASPYALNDRPKSAKAEVEVDGYGTRYDGKKLSAIIEDAIDSAGAEKADFKATEQQREALKQMFPGLSFDQALAKIVQIDRDAFKDPIGTAATVAASFGMDVLPHQTAEKAEVDHLVGHIDQAIAQTGMNVERVTEIVNNPQFVRSGDHVHDLHRAVAISQQLDRQDAQAGAWVAAELKSMDRKLAETLWDISTRDPSYIAQANHIRAAAQFGDPTVPVRLFELARGMATARMASQRAAVGKAKRAGKVRSSSGTNPRGSDSGESGIDRAIANAMRSWGD